MFKHTQRLNAPQLIVSTLLILLGVLLTPALAHKAAPRAPAGANATANAKTAVAPLIPLETHDVNPLPISAPPALPRLPVVEGDAWNLDWTLYRLLPITAPHDLPAGTLMKVDGLDLSSLVAQGSALPSMDDMRVVRRIDDTHWQEVPRAIYTAWDLEFFTSAPLAAGVHRDYYLIYGNPAAGSAPTYTMSQGVFVDLYTDKGGTEWNQTLALKGQVNFREVCEPPIDHRSRTGSAFDDSERVRGRIFVPTSGTWTFTAFMPDGYHFALDGGQIGNFEGYDIARWVTLGSKDLKAGWYTLDLLDIWVNCGPLRLAMSGPGFTEQIVPDSYLQQFWADTQHVTPDEETAFDSIPPTVRMIAPADGVMAAYAAPLQLQWEGQDDPEGSGIKNYILAQSFDAGQTFTTITTTTSITYSIQPTQACHDVIYQVTARDRGLNLSIPDQRTVQVQLQGDFNADGAIDVSDEEQIDGRWGSQQGQRDYRSHVDLSQDGRINAADTLWLQRHSGDQCP